MEAGYSEKVEELCDRYSLKGFLNFKGMLQENHHQIDFNYEQLKENAK